MRLFATLLAITGLITLGLIVTGVFWLISRWAGKMALPEIRSGGLLPSKSSSAEKRTLAQGMSLTHSKRGK